MKITKNLMLLLCLSAAAFSSSAEQSSSQWLRNPAISPNGKTIAFTHQGDIFTVESSGGAARQITSNPAYDTKPIWSPNGDRLMFASNRLGSIDIFVVDAKGGVPSRVTTNSGSETPIAFLNDTTALFSSYLMPSQYSVQFPSSQLSQIYSVSINGSRPELFNAIAMESVSISEDGSKIIYVDKKGYEDPMRKHHRSSITRDIWSVDYNDGKLSNFTKLTDFRGEDRDPQFVALSKSEFFYTSEQDNTLNVYKRDINSKKESQLTTHKDFPVRSLTVASNNLLCYSYNGELYTLDGNNSSSKPKKVDISITTDQLERDEIKQILTSGAAKMSISPNGKEIAFILKGDVYVTSVEYSTTKQITNSATQERTVDFAPDGRSVVYDSERDGLWQIYQSSIVDKNEESLLYSTKIEEKRLTNSQIASFKPQYSPDGKSVAFLEDRTGLKVLNLKSEDVVTARDKKYEYSYSDGDQWFEWSPDSRWLMSGYIGEGGWNSNDIAIFKADGSGESYNLTKSGYSDRSGKWVLGGKAMVWFSDKAGYRSHGSWGAQTDAYIMFFDLEAYEKFRMNREELSLLSEKEDKGKKEEKAEKDSTKVEKVEPLELDLINAEDRIIRLTDNSTSLSDAVLSNDGLKLYYVARYESKFELWVKDIEKHSTKLLTKNSGSGELIPSKDGKDIFMSSGGQLKKIDTNSGEITPIPFEAQFTYRPKQERDYMFNHVWQQVADKFYLKDDLHGAPWQMYREAYSAKLDNISNNTDFAELLSEMLGELNASHTGARHYAANSAQPTASLGVYFDESYKGDGLKISEIIKGSPLNIIKSDIKEGYIIEKIDGTTITSGMDYFPLLEGKTNKPVMLTVKKTSKSKSFQQSVKPISSAALGDLLYKRWVDSRAAVVDSLSGGRLAYVHIKAMDSNSFREMYSELLGKYRNKEAVIVDTRNNGGGWLHDDVVSLLSGEKYQDFVAHGQYIGSDPYNKWTKPSCMLMCENNYSNAHGTPWVYKTLGIGSLIGTPVPGTMTAVWWERLIDSSIVFGIPQVGCVGNDGSYAENNELQPDILIYNTPEDIIDGRDKQLERAIEHMLSQL